MDKREIVRRWKELAGFTWPSPDDSDALFGFFQCFRPLEHGIEAALKMLPRAREVEARLRELYRVTAAGFARTDRIDMYFVVREPVPTAESELLTLAARQLCSWREIAHALGNDKLADGIPSTAEVVPGGRSASNLAAEDSPETAIYEAEGDWHGQLGSICPFCSVLREAFYSIACDYTIARYLTWPWYQGSTTIIEPFGAYFELWCRGVRLAVPQPGRAIVYNADGMLD